MKYLSSDDEHMSKSMGLDLDGMIDTIRSSIKAAEMLRDIAASGQKNADKTSIKVDMAAPFNRKIERLQDELAFYEAQR